MTTFIRFLSVVLCCGASCLWLADSSNSRNVNAQTAQDPKPANQQPAPEPQETFRISTVLVQTDVSVFDKQGNFIDGLPREAFELKVDGKAVPVALFQRITAGSAEEEANLAAARGKWKPGTISAANPLNQGQSVIFFVDDYHLEGEHIQRAQQIIYNYLDRNLRAGDRMMIASSSGQLGFLQQFSDDAEILRMTAGRLKYQPATKADTERPQMNLVEALGISRNQPSVMEYMLQQYRVESLYYKTNPIMLRQIIQQRANGIVQFHRTTNTAMFSTLEALLRGVAGVPGRKLLFFLSSGFVSDSDIDSTMPTKLTRLVDGAARAGVVIYTVDARGLQSVAPDISANISTSSEASGTVAPADATGLAYDAVRQTQQSLRILAYDTGGQPILNTNGLETKVSQAVREYQNYYVLAWEPEVVETTTEKDKPKFRKLEVTVKGRPDLQVRVRRGFFETSPPPEMARTEKKSDKKPAAKNEADPAPAPVVDPLTAAVRTIYPQRELPLSLYAAFQNDTATGSAISATLELPGEAVAAIGSAGEVELLCVVIDAQGKAVQNDGKKLSFARPGSVAPLLTANFRLVVPPGVYQVRAAARDVRTGRVGSEYQWLKIPQFTPGKLALSSLLLSEKPAPATNADTPALKTSRRFARSSKLLFQLSLYNAARNGNQPPNLTLEIQVKRQTQTVLNAPAHPVAIPDPNDLARILYSAEIPLRGLAPGLYTLQVKVTDTVKKAVATEQINFVVE